DSTSPLITKFLGHCEYVQRHYEKALPLYLHASALDSRYPGGYYWAGRAYLAMTNYPAALDEMEQHELKRGGLEPSYISNRYKKYREALEKGARSYWMNRTPTPSDEGARIPTAYHRAERFAHLRDKTNALAWLEKALAQRDSMENLLMDEFWDDF